MVGFSYARMSGNAALGILSSLCGLAILVVNIMYCYKLATAFGKGVGFTLGLLILNPIFILILGFGSAEYLDSDK